MFWLAPLDDVGSLGASNVLHHRVLDSHGRRILQHGIRDGELRRFRQGVVGQHRRLGGTVERTGIDQFPGSGRRGGVGGPLQLGRTSLSTSDCTQFDTYPTPEFSTVTSVLQASRLLTPAPTV